MGMDSEVLIRLIQEKISEKYGNPHAAAEAINQKRQLNEKSLISEDTVARIYYRTTDSEYMPRRDSLLIIAEELGISTKDDDDTTSQDAETVKECLNTYHMPESKHLLAYIAIALGKLEQQYSNLAQQERKKGYEDGIKKGQEEAKKTFENPGWAAEEPRHYQDRGQNQEHNKEKQK